MIEEDRTGQSVLKKENNEEKEKDEDDNVGIDVKKKDYKKKKMAALKMNIKEESE